MCGIGAGERATWCSVATWSSPPRGDALAVQPGARTPSSTRDAGHRRFHRQPTAGPGGACSAVGARAAPAATDFVDATDFATALMGDSHRHQHFHAGLRLAEGPHPDRRGAIEQAIELNGAAVEANPQALRTGAAAPPQACRRRARWRTPADGEAGSRASQRWTRSSAAASAPRPPTRTRPSRALRGSVERVRAAETVTGVRARPAHRGRRALLLQAHGLQGRVRSRAPLRRRRF